jgi:signal transduction histidine kinase/CheY-like chemotaxis protein
MKIRIKLYLLSIFAVLLVLLVVGTLMISTREVNQASMENRAAHDIIRTLFELGSLTSDYLLHGSVRAQTQWSRKHNALTRLVNAASFQYGQDQEILRRISNHTRELAVIFGGVVHAQTMITDGDNEAALALKQRYMGQLDARSQAIVSDASDLERRSSSRVDVARHHAGVIAITAVITLAGFMGLVSLLFHRSVLRPIGHLHVGTEIIGSGDLGYKVDTGVKDEVGDLSRSFDEMTERLKAVTVSRDELAREVVERKRAEEEARQARQAAEKANQAKSQFLANMSHELRTPLNSVIGFANVLGKNKSEHLDANELLYLQRIVANGKHLLFLINQVLDLAKIEVRKVQADWKLVDLRDLVQQVMGQFEVLAQSKAIRLVWDVPESTPMVVTDPVKMTQVLINLIGNAVKFTEHGEVKVTVVLASPGGRPCRIEVCDTGIGIAEDRIGAVFEAFQQADSGTARKYGGSGLGLTISRALCDVMGCRIEAVSRLGQGSTFSIVMPDMTGTPGLPEGAEATRVAGRERRGMGDRSSAADRTVLVIDDEPDARVLMSNLIEEAGCRVMVASSGEQGLQMARDFHPDAITLDLMMPTMDGWAVLKELESDPRLRDIPVVVVSVEAHEQRGLVLGVVGMLQKPVERDALMEVLKNIVHPPARVVLVVDDNEDDRRLMALHLQGSDYEVRMAASGFEALQMMEASVPDALVVDLIMPEMDGSALIHRIRADDRYRHLPVVIVTGRDLTVAERQALRLQAVDVLPKSGGMETELLRVLGQVFAAKDDRLG